MIELPKEDNPLCSCKLPVFDVAADGPHMICRPQDLTTGADDSTIHTVMPFMEEFNPDGHPMMCHVCNHWMHNSTIDDYCGACCLPTDFGGQNTTSSDSKKPWGPMAHDTATID